MERHRPSRWVVVFAALLLILPLIGGVFQFGASANSKPQQRNSHSEREENTSNSQRSGRASRHQESQKEARDDEEDADLPAFLKTKVDKQRYLRARQQYINLMRGLPYPKDLPYNPRVKAIREMEAQEAEIMPLINGTTWTPIGPAPIPNGQTVPTKVAVSGRVTAIDVHPTNPNLAYVGTAQGGVYRTTDGGNTWTPLLDQALSLAVGAVAIAPSQPSTVFVGTGEANLSADSFFGVGVYIITNADTSPVVTGPFNSNGTSDVMTGRAIGKILVNPTDPNTIFVTTASGTASNPSSTTNLVVPAAGLFRCTNALSGTPTFTKLTVATANGGNRSSTDAVIDPSNPNNVLCTVFGTNAAGDGGIYRSTNALATTPTFTRTLTLGTATAGVRATLSAISGGTTVYTATGETVGTANGCTANATGAVRKSTDGGATWSTPIGIPTGGGGFCGGQCFYDLPIAVNGNTVMVGGSADSTSSNPCRTSIMVRSTDGGVSFSRNDGNLHADEHVITFAPSNTNIAYTGNDGGIFKSTDGGASWHSMNTATFSATQFQSLALHPIDRFFALGGTQDNGTELMGQNGLWNRADFGDGGYALIDQTAVDAQTLTMYHTYFNQVNNIVGFARVTSIGSAVEGSWSFFGSNGIPNGITNPSAVLFYAPIALGTSINPNALYFGSDRLYRSIDQGTTMTPVSQVVASGIPISTIAVSPQDDNYRIIGMNRTGNVNKVLATTTGANPLLDVSSTSFPLNPVTRVTFDPNNKNVAYCTFSGFGVPAGSHIWKNTNLTGGSANWVPAGSGIPDVPVDCIVVDPQDSNNIYAGTDIGVFNSTNGGTSWVPFGSGLPRVAVFDLQIQNQNRVLRAATHGRGIFEITIPGNVISTVILNTGTITATPTTGNGNAFIEPGENAMLTVPLINTGNATVTGVSATITTSTPGITITNGTSAYPNIAGMGGSANNSTPFTFLVQPSALCGVGIQFTMTVTYNGNNSPRTFTFTVATGQPGTTASTFSYTGPAVPIPDANATGISVPLPVSGLTGGVSNIKFRIDGTSCSTAVGATTVGIDHTFVGDLTISVIAPSGKTITMAAGNGGAGINFCQTTFDDAATSSITGVTAAQNPFTGSFSPVQPLAGFNGENPNGTWMVKVVDGGAQDTGSLRAFSLIITPATCASPCAPITISPSTLTNAVVGTAYTQTLSASGGIAPYTFSLASGNLPSGLTLSTTGVISGTPTASGSFSFTVSATDNSGNSCMGTQAYTLKVCPVITLSPTTLQNQVAGKSFSVTLTASGGTAPYTFALASGSLPAGVTLSSAGLLSGTPTSSGTFNFTVMATDSTGCANGLQSYTLVVACTSLLFSPGTLPSGTARISYSATIVASNGTAPYTFSLGSGSLPPGLTLASNGKISGTPTAPGSYTFTVNCSDVNGCAGSKSYTIQVCASAISLSALSVNTAKVGSLYSQPISASGGSAPYTFTISSGSLPSGFSLSSAGVISGTARATGTFTFTVKATDANGCSGTRTYTITVTL